MTKPKVKNSPYGKDDFLLPTHKNKEPEVLLPSENGINDKSARRKTLITVVILINLLVWGLNIFYLYVLKTERLSLPRIHKSLNQDAQKLSPQALKYKSFVSELKDGNNRVKNVINNFVSASLPDHQEQQLERNVGIIDDSKKDEPIPSARASANQCDVIPVILRFDCLPKWELSQSSQEECEDRGCCWRPVTSDEAPPQKPRRSRVYPSYLAKKRKSDESKMDIPFCFYPPSYSLYNASDLHYKPGRMISGKLRSNARSGYPKDVSLLTLEVRFETCSRVRIRISDPNRQRWETPLPAVPKSVPGCQGTPLYDVNIVQQGAQIVVSRKDTAEPLFDTRTAAPLIFSDQFIQLSTILPSSYIYGLGQHLDGLLLDTNWHRRVLWNADRVPDPQTNLYGSHPFYMVMEPRGSAHGVFLLNSNAIEVILQPTPALTFRTIGGILDLYVFLGTSPDQVISQYTEVIGRPFLPPYWSLGYHQCRFGYESLEGMKKVWKRTRDAGIPFDVQWNDIDYMKNQNDFTIDSEKYSGLPEFVEELHKLGMHYVMITDTGISAGEETGKYPPFDMGIKDDVFVKNSKGKLFIGKVWNPTATVFPDFTKPNAVIYWSHFIRTFRKQLPFDGLWIDMNEPSNFWDGEKDGCPENSTLEHPPYLPDVAGGKLYHKTLCMTAKHYLGDHYNVHNLYGLSEVISTYVALKMTEGVPEPFIISRSSFPGLGKFSGHWTGDVYSDWFDLWKSIGDVLTTNLLGIPMVGADICGFNGNTTVDLCNRWMQLGAFYPFARNHNTDNAIDQDPVALGNLVVRSSRKALLQRYTLLPFLYTLFYKAHSAGVPVARPLFFKYPQDSETLSIDTQFLWGNELMIIPVLEEVAISVEAYFPEGRWYDWYTGGLYTKKGNEYMTLPAPLDTIPIAVAGGSVLPCQVPGNTTAESRRHPFGLIVALNEENRATGELVWNKSGQPGYTHWKFRAVSHQFVSAPEIISPSDEELTLGWITFFGVTFPTSVITLNGNSINFTYSAVSQVLKIENLSVNFKKTITLFYV